MISLKSKEDDKALDFFENTYSPIRKKQEANFEKLKDLTHKYSDFKIDQIHEKKRLDALMTIGLLLTSTFIGAFFVFS